MRPRTPPNPGPANRASAKPADRADRADRAATKKRRSGKPAWLLNAPPRLVTGVRVLMFAVFAFYGSVKLLGGQYDYGDWVISNRTADGTSVVWAFYGYSPVYGRFTGLYELLPALMLLSRRTAVLGAMGLFAVSLNITVMDFAYGYPMVKYFALAYTLLCLFLVVQDRDRLLAAFWHRPSQRADPGLRPQV